MMLFRVLFVAAALCVCAPADAHAAFLVPIIASTLAVSTFVAEVIVTVGSVALSVGLSWLSSKLLAPDSVGASELDLRVDATIPQSLIVGRAVTAGSLVYAAAGSSGYAGAPSTAADSTGQYRAAARPITRASGTMPSQPMRESVESTRWSPRTK